MHLKSDNIQVIIKDKPAVVIEKLFESFLNKYQIGLATSMGGNDFIFDSVNLLYNKCHKINFKRSGSYEDSPYRIKNNNNNNKKKTINLFSKKG